MSIRPGVRIGVDVGRARVGVARTDEAGTLSIPLRTLQRAKNLSDVEIVVRLIKEWDAIEVIVGLPRHLGGHEGDSATDARQYAELIAERVSVPVRLVDERLSTVVAHKRLSDAGRKRTGHKPVVDQVAAGIILDFALECERGTGNPPGELVETKEHHD